jgi:hypothetical protein
MPSSVKAVAKIIEPTASFDHRYPKMLGVVTTPGSKSRIAACTARSRGVSRPSSSPSTNAPRPP